MDSFGNRRRKRTKKKKHNERIINDRTIRNIRTLFEQEKEDYYEHKRFSNFWNNNYIECESNWGRLQAENYCPNFDRPTKDMILILFNS